MADLNHFWSEDLSASPNGDIALVQPLSAEDAGTSGGNDEGTQRIYRRLMSADAEPNTLSGECIFHPSYGGGIPRRIGGLMNPSRDRATIRTQMYKEASVAKSPAPKITLTAALPSSVFVAINYVNAQTGVPIALSFDLSA